MAFAYAFEKLDGSGSSSKESGTPSTTSATSDTANTANNANNQAGPTYSTSTDQTDQTSTYPGSTSTGPGYSTYPTSTYPTTQTQNGYQQRAVDRDLPADIFGEPHLESRFIDSLLMVSSFSPGLQMLDPPRIIIIKIGEEQIK